MLFNPEAELILDQEFWIEKMMTKVVICRLLISWECWKGWKGWMIVGSGTKNNMGLKGVMEFLKTSIMMILRYLVKRWVLK